MARRIRRKKTVAGTTAVVKINLKSTVGELIGLLGKSSHDKPAKFQK